MHLFVLQPARVSLKSGCEGVSAINTIMSVMGINLDTLRPEPCVEGLRTTLTLLQWLHFYSFLGIVKCNPKFDVLGIQLLGAILPRQSILSHLQKSWVLQRWWSRNLMIRTTHFQPLEVLKQEVMLLSSFSLEQILFRYNWGLATVTYPWSVYFANLHPLFTVSSWIYQLVHLMRFPECYQALQIMVFSSCILWFNELAKFF